MDWRDGLALLSMPVFEFYYNLSSVTLFVCALTTQTFTDLQAPNLAGRSGRGSKNTSRKRNLKIPIGCHGNQEIMSQLRYQSDCPEIFNGKIYFTIPMCLQKMNEIYWAVLEIGPLSNCLTTIAKRWLPWWRHSRVWRHRVTSRARRHSHVCQNGAGVLRLPNFEFFKSDHH